MAEDRQRAGERQGELRSENERTPAHPDDHRHPGGWRVSPSPDGRGKPHPERPQSGLSAKWLITLALIFGLYLWLTVALHPSAVRVQVPYNPFFLQQVREGNVASISSQGSTVQGEFRTPTRYPPSDAKAKASTGFSTEIPTFADTQALSRLLVSKGVLIKAKPASSGGSLVATLLVTLLPMLLIAGLLVMLFRRAAGGAGGIGGFRRSGARRVEPSQQRVDFDDVAGIDDAKDELTEIVDFLRDPAKYRRLGGRIPRGVLLTGPPGTGKTLLARALAGEAQVPFFSISASEFVEMFVGVGASRVRDLFQQAKESAPAIIFIDELDAIGRKRGGYGAMGGHDEREQTLNQILTEMDGFDPSIGVIVLSATNRPEILDPALLRPGRFDRRVAVQPPDTVGRRRILDVHTRSVPLGDDVDLDRLAAITVGMVGADLANVVNEGALLAARRGNDSVTMRDVLDALEKLVLGSERRITLSEEERRRTAYHEAGHALVAMLTPCADPVRKVSIIPRGAALGVTLSAPGADRFSYDRPYLLGKIAVALGGRVAEELVYGEVTTGAEADLRDLTEIARNMVTRWGMSDEVGLVYVFPPEAENAMPGGPHEPSLRLRELVDAEIRRLVDEAHEHVTELLVQHRVELESLVQALLQHETLDEDEAYTAASLAPAVEAEAAEPAPLVRHA